jgi:tryptophanase
VFYGMRELDSFCWRRFVSAEPQADLFHLCRAHDAIRGRRCGKSASPVRLNRGFAVRRAVLHDLLHPAIPRRVYTQSHIDYLVEAILEVNERKDQIRGSEIVYEPEFLRHFTARFRPL